jgi:hypothetical protein
MPRTIATNQIDGIDLSQVTIDDHHPGAYGFIIRLTQAADPEWIAEFDDSYRRIPHPVAPPVTIDGDHMTVHYLPAYLSELSGYLAHIEDVVREANRQVDARNAALPDDSEERLRFLDALHTAAAHFPTRIPQEGNR